MGQDVVVAQSEEDVLGDVALRVRCGDAVEGCLGMKGILGVKKEWLSCEGTRVTHWENFDIWIIWSLGGRRNGNMLNGGVSGSSFP